MTDPRIKRTRLHVLETTRALLAERRSSPLSFSVIAEQAQVSRRTLYTHWGTVDKVISEAITSHPPVGLGDAATLPASDRLRAFLRDIRSSISDAVTNAALASLMNLATHDDGASSSLKEMGQARIEQFRQSVAPITAEQYAQLVGPLFISQFMNGEPGSDALIDALVVHGLATLDVADHLELVSA
ncbi:TetR/AcrR family transcriptional regulator [Glaciihabitans sp. dw_435]|uniref:TetR/AcrR family transcriptional regulator n=1 Tax=Glaciihabitans sp. dw_435 TaxID=2720081 RepID=UPI001BD2E188|nr:TetR/AcrR family transcriptional regulator [Glaciihabitans sp. dw_435]